MGGDSFAFDGLSSGQKEIISTLFLVWHYTRESPAIVMIDEPELHLNAQWHRDFVREVVRLAPNNQYLMATHSEDVFASVPASQRLSLRGPGTTEGIPGGEL
ncbi:MAG: ATP-binding protein [Magnetococcus sp. WYHC-3]